MLTKNQVIEKLKSEIGEDLSDQKDWPKKGYELIVNLPLYKMAVLGLSNNEYITVIGHGYGKFSIGRKTFNVNAPKAKIHDIEKETPIMPEVAADAVANKLFGYLYQHGEKKSAQFVYDKNLEIVIYLSEALKRVYAINERFRKEMKRIKTIDKVHAFMEHWLAGWLKDKAPAILKSLPSGYGWSTRLNPPNTEEIWSTYLVDHPDGVKSVVISNKEIKDYPYKIVGGPFHALQESMAYSMFNTKKK
jgi:hypothetical protein